MRIFAWRCSFLLLLPSIAVADAGFNIGRPKAPCFAVFTGIDQLTGFEFFRINENDHNARQNIEDSTNRLHDNDTVKLYYGDERRHWQGPVKILVRDKSTHQFVDSFSISAEGYNLTYHFSNSGNKAPAYAIDKTKAVYPYSLYSNEEVDQAGAKRNKYILVAMSVIGFLLLFVLFFKRKNSSENKTV